MKNKKFKHGSLAIIITVAVIALVIVLNYAFTALSQAKSIYVDMTENKVFSVSDAADEIISNLGDKQFDFVFFTPFDKMVENSYQQQVYKYCCALADKYDFIKIQYIDSLTHPEEVEQYQNNEIPDLDTTDVVITNGSAWQAFKIDSFFTFDESSKEVFAFNGEYRICTALMQMSYENLLACFTTGHGETTVSSSLMTVFSEAGFEVQEVDLTKDDIPEDTRILVINNPIYDFGGAYSDVNEIDKIDKYLDKLGNMMVFEDPSVVSMLTNLDEYLEEWGIKFNQAKIKDYTNAISTDGTCLVAKYSEEGSAAGLNKSLRELENPPKTVVANAMPIEIIWSQHNQINVSSVLTSYDTAEAYSLSDDKKADQGEFNLMTVSTQATVASNNETYYNYVLCAGTSSFADDKYLNGNTYGNRDIIYEAMRVFCKKVVPVDLDFKVYDDNSLDLTNGQATAWTIVFVAAGPVICTICGIIMYSRRKRI